MRSHGAASQETLSPYEKGLRSLASSRMFATLADGICLACLPVCFNDLSRMLSSSGRLIPAVCALRYRKQQSARIQVHVTMVFQASSVQEGVFSASRIAFSKVLQKPRRLCKTCGYGGRRRIAVPSKIRQRFSQQQRDVWQSTLSCRLVRVTKHRACHLLWSRRRRAVILSWKRKGWRRYRVQSSSFWRGSRRRNGPHMFFAKRSTTPIVRLQRFFDSKR